MDAAVRLGRAFTAKPLPIFLGSYKDELLIEVVCALGCRSSSSVYQLYSFTSFCLLQMALSSGAYILIKGTYVLLGSRPSAIIYCIFISS